MNFFDFEYRVRYGDTDKLGVSYYANYFVWFEAARTEYFRALGYPYTECEKRGYFLPVIETKARYYAPSTYDDLVVIRTSVNQIGHSSIRFEYLVFNQETKKRLATGYSVHVFVDRQMQATRIPSEIAEIVTPFSVLEGKLAS